MNLFNFFRNKNEENKPVIDADTIEFQKNKEALIKEYGVDLKKLPLNYFTAKVMVDLLERVKHLEERNIGCFKV